MSTDTTPGAAPSTQDALQLLHADHQRIDALLTDCARLDDADPQATHSADHSALLARLGALLQAHTQIEQELFYPLLDIDEAARQRALDEHGDIVHKLHELADSEAPPAQFSERMAALAQAVRAHVAEEEATLFAQATAQSQAAGPLDLAALGTRLSLRHAELLGDQGVD